VHQYRYGFTEAAYNSQQVNIGGQGKGNDRLNISVSDRNGEETAWSWTAPDGELVTDCCAIIVS
jgi:extracellular elastinolytic metalloproteinase